jgi:phosphoribosylformylglycinamidine synthase
MTTDCNSTYVFADPYKGAMMAVAEAARNIVCAGGEPVAITNCLNFGNPYNPEVYYQFTEVIRGMGEACRAFETPVTGGNVSFYNQYQKNGVTVPVYPTPTIGMLGILDDADHMMTLDFKREGDVIYQIGETQNDLGSCEYIRFVHGIEFSNAPYFDLKEELSVQKLIKKLIKKRLLSSCHDISEGGLFATLLESAMVRGLGFDILTEPNLRKDAFLFGESQSRILVSVDSENVSEFENLMNKQKIPYFCLGSVTTGELQIDNEIFGNIESWRKNYENVLPEKMN